MIPVVTLVRYSVSPRNEAHSLQVAFTLMGIEGIAQEIEMPFVRSLSPKPSFSELLTMGRTGRRLFRLTAGPLLQ